MTPDFKTWLQAIALAGWFAFVLFAIYVIAGQAPQ